MGVAGDNQALVLEAAAGHVDMQRRQIDNLANKPVLAENVGQGRLQVLRRSTTPRRTRWRST